MAGRGRGRGKTITEKNDREYLNMSLEDLIKKGRGSPWPEARSISIEEKDDRQHINMSLDDLIKMKKGRGRGRSLQGSRGIDTVDCTPASKNLKYTLDVSGTLGARKTNCQARDYKEDVFKSLDDVIEERGIIKPPGKYRNQTDDNELPITGRNSLPRKRERDDNVQLAVHPGGKQRRLLFTPKFVLTPYRAVSYLSEKGMIINLRIGKRIVESADEEDPFRKWRCIVSCGAVQGVADCMRKTVAREIACDGFIRNLKEICPDGKIPHYEIPSDLLLDPKVIDKVQKMAEETGTQVSYEFSLVREDEDKQAPAKGYSCVCYLGERKFVGTSSASENFAKVKAADQAHEFLRGETYPKTVYFANDDCDLKVEYDFSESEIYQKAEKVETDDTFAIDMERLTVRCHSMLEDDVLHC